MLTTGPLKENEKTEKKGTSYPRRRREVEKLLIGTKSAKILDNRRKGKGSVMNGLTLFMKSRRVKRHIES